VADAVGDELGHEQAHVREQIDRQPVRQLALDQPAGARRGVRPARNVGIDAERLHV
jgi:hypothetical protein